MDEMMDEKKNEERENRRDVTIQIQYPDGTEKERMVPRGTRLLELLKEEKPDGIHEYAGAFCNRRLRELHSHMNSGGKVSFVSIHSRIGFDLYKRSLILLMLAAASDVLEKHGMSDCVHILYSLGQGFFCRIEKRADEKRTDIPREEKAGDSVPADVLIPEIRDRMQQLCRQDLMIEKKTVSTRLARENFRKRGLTDKEKVLKYRRSSRMNVYQLNGYTDYFYGYMLPSTGFLKGFDLVPYEDGFVLVLPDPETLEIKPYTAPAKLYRCLRKTEDWGDMMGVSGVGEINDIIVEGRMNELMLVQEALMEKQIADIAERIRSEEKRLVLIAGPSSSGKTTFSRRLSVQLTAHGLRPHAITMDNFFKEREDTPKGPDGKYDFESLSAMDLDLFNRDMADLLQGKMVEMPTFDFMIGEKVYNGESLQIGPQDVLVVEGIHALNPASTSALPHDSSFKIYISALTQLNLDEHNRISTTDTRLLRRIVRDARTRGNDARKTISMWPSVRKGEEQNIFPFQEESDVMFNSALIYELSAIKLYVEPLLFGVPEESAEYYEAKRLLKFLDYFLGVDASNLPQNSLMREFIGGGCFRI